MRHARLLIVLLLIGLPQAPAKAAPERIVSLNLCADQMLLALADRGQIAALSHLATDPGISAAAGAARGLPQTRGTAEEVLPLRPDLVLLGSLDRLGTGRLLAARGIKVVRLPLPSSFAGTQALIRQVAGLVGRPERGEALAAALEPPQEAEARFTALPYERRGYAAGAGGLMGEILARAGFRHAWPASGQGGFVSLEQVVARRPDVLVVEETGGTADQGAALLAHPALARLYPPERRIALPRVLTACPGPGLAEAVRRLAAHRATMLPP